MSNLDLGINDKLLILNNSVNELIAFFEQKLNYLLKVYTHWTAKDVLGHLTFWHKSFARNLKALTEGQKPNVLKGKLSEVNTLSVTSTKDISINDLRGV